MTTCWRLDGARQTLVLGSENGALPHVLYWGPRLGQDEDLAAIAAARGADFTGGCLDAPVEISLCPEAARTFPGQAGLRARDARGHSLHMRFSLRDVIEERGSLTVRAEDAALGLRYSAQILSHPASDLFELSAELESDAPIAVDWFAAPVLPVAQDVAESIEFSGRWVGEFQTCRVPWSMGARLRHAPLGRSGHEHPPLLYLPSGAANNTQGSAAALHFGWSGGHTMIAEELPDGRRQVQFGKLMGSHLAPATRFASGSVFAASSETGLNGCAIAFQRHVHDELTLQKRMPRPVHYNCWEAIYFDHDLDALKAIADRAAALGAERFVLDDGWFGARDDDTTSLGDWQIDARKYPGGLGPLIDHVHARGMSFGIWFEPEMVSPDSDLFRAHPDWALGPADQLLGRQQMVLDMARTEVREALFGMIAAVLSAHRIDYVKWDHNRLLPYADAAQAEGSYALLDRLRAAFPETEIESCASGGGRIDFGILARTGRVWLSDSNDALERLKIQHGAALLLPASVTGSHVGPRHCHSSHRTLSMPFRAWIAAQRHMGFEMDPRELTAEEAEVLTRVTAWWKANRDWRMNADIHRLDSDDPAVIAELQLCRSRGRFVVFAAQAEVSAQSAPRPLRLAALEPEGRYRISLANREDISALSRGKTALEAGDIVLSGRILMTQGLALPFALPEQVWVLEGEKL
ncbi:alpha-galactosidase [Poseidonocella sedimentorum]|uniref:alpha-galactosidase n=1 Tax=Poseidonocella sedimentorum TaxID=871652 RepID=A0A1I6D683_9RHOB|nr:alpha-galactosidase [Poseidonocella sedimentorum]SFR00975.1 alpha-galactosidase [Poseidonocella sedimentorum]